MYELTQPFIEQELADERCGWTDRQKEMLTGMSSYLGDVKSDFETAIAVSTGTNPPAPELPPEEPDEQS